MGTTRWRAIHSESAQIAGTHMNTVRHNLVGFFCVLLIACLTGCSDRPLAWTEDVLLPDSRVVTLKRYQEFEGPHEIGDTPTESDYWFEFKHPDTGETVRWESDRDLDTLALMIHKGIPMLLVKPSFGSSLHRYKCPNPPYLLLEYGLHTWRDIPLQRLPVKTLRANMTFAAKA